MFGIGRVPLSHQAYRLGRLQLVWRFSPAYRRLYSLRHQAFYVDFRRLSVTILRRHKMPSLCLLRWLRRRLQHLQHLFVEVVHVGDAALELCVQLCQRGIVTVCSRCALRIDRIGGRGCPLDHSQRGVRHRINFFILTELFELD